METQKEPQKTSLPGGDGNPLGAGPRVTGRARHEPKQPQLLNRRRFLQVASMTGGVAILSACTAPAAPVPAAEEGEGGEGGPAAETTSIAWWNQYSTATTQEVIPQVIEGFQNEYPGVTVEYEISGGPPGGGEYLEVLLARIAAGNPPNTATLFDPPVQFAARGSLTQIDDYMENARWATPEAFFEGPLNSCRWRGNTFGLPASAGAGCIFINAEKFAEAGLPTTREEFPTTWEGLADLSAQLTAWSDGELQQAGLVPWATPWLKPVWSELNGSQLFNAETGEYTIATDENIAWIEHWKNWLDEQFQGDVEQLNLYGEYGDAYPDGAFQLGITAMVQSGSWATSDADIPFEWEVMRFPVGPSGGDSVTGYWPNWFVIPTGAAEVDVSFNYIEWWATRGWEIWYTGIMDTPAWRDFPQGVLTEKLVNEQGPERAQELHNFFADYLNDAIDMWNSPVENFASDTLNAAIDEVLHGVTTPSDALAEAQTLIQTRLDETIES